MRIGAIDYVWPQLPPETRFRHIVNLGFKGVQLWFAASELGFDVPKTWYPRPYEIRTISRKKIVNILEDVGLEVSAIGPQIILGEEPEYRGASGSGTFSTSRRRKERIEKAKLLIDFAAEIGVANVIVFSGGDPRRKGEQWNSLVELTVEIVDYAEKSNVVLAMENMVQLLVDDEDTMLRLINDVGSKNLKVNFDPKNLNITPPRRRNVIEAIRKLSEFIVHVHMGDSIYGGGEFGKGPNGHFILPELGKGEVPIRECIGALRDIGYEGWIILEHLAPSPEERERIVVEGKKYIENILDTSS